MEALLSPKVLSYHITAWCNDPGGSNLYLHHCENLKYMC